MAGVLSNSSATPLFFETSTGQPLAIASTPTMLRISTSDDSATRSTLA